MLRFPVKSMRFSDRLVIGLLAALTAIAQKPAPTVTFYKQIAPIVYKNCAPCHRPGESAPFSLLTYEDVKRHAPQIAKVTKSRFMPPWLPAPGYGDFAEERRLTDEQVRVIQEWVRQGSPAASAAHAPAPPKFTSDCQMGPPDLVLRTGRPYSPPADGQ